MTRFLFPFLLFPFVLSAQGYLCAVGGGGEDYKDWSDKPYSWIVEKSGKGKVIVLSANTETTWIPDYFKSFGASSAVNLKIATKSTADLQSTYDAIVSASAVFIKGGDQWDYISQWKGTKTEDAIRQVFLNGGVIAGTSAGAMVLGSVAFSAKSGSVYPVESLNNPFHSKIQLETDFLNLVPDVLFDTHVAERGRIGRLIPFVFNYTQKTGNDLLGVGIDDLTALCIEPNGNATVMGSGAVSFVRKDAQTTFTSDATGYAIENIRCDQLVDGWVYNLNSKEIVTIPSSAKQLPSDRPFLLPETNLWMTGSNLIKPNLNQSLSPLLSRLNPSQITVISSETTDPSLDSLLSLLSASNTLLSLFTVSDASLASPTESEKLNAAGIFVVSGKNLTTLAKLADTTTIAGSVFRKKVSQKTPVYAIGNGGKMLGGSVIGNTDSDGLASWYGRMTVNPGLAVFPDLVVQPLIYDDDEFYENRTTALSYGLMRGRKQIGLFLNPGSLGSVNAEKKTLSVSGSFPLFLADATGSHYADSSKHKASGGKGPRQVAAFDNLRFSVSTSKRTWSMVSKTLQVSEPVSVESDNKKTFDLLDNYPNPFNNGTMIRFSLSEGTQVSLVVYDVLGRQIATLTNSFFTAGNHQISFAPPTNLASGLYFYRLETPAFSQTQKMTYIR
ncbi:MAG: Type 1 glutamine amidotransferase-like domain-containing protein [Bacteroidetes bacterium]|nr:Type 1 glutamine amidotransferase-like domain-containing protein [Bacteroidota bacterium]